MQHQHHDQHHEAGAGELVEMIDEFRSAVESELMVNPDDIHRDRACKTCLHSALYKESDRYAIACMFSPANMQFVSSHLFCSQYSEGGALLKSNRDEIEDKINLGLDLHKHLIREVK